jgi:exopolyphosphatase / guanosine-5'-triphosphate,3'-diphosphate pyrophosphatase
MIAAIDCGTNTIKLLIGDPAGAVPVRESRVVRLGQGVDRTGRLSDEALARTFAAIDEYAALIAAHPVTRLRFCATSATRDAGNAAEFSDGVFARLGVRPEVISGDEEARLAYGGAVRHLAAAPAWPVLVVDIGGGSTELILGDQSGVRTANSMDIGSVRLSERHLGSDPPTEAELAACVAEIDAHLDNCPVDPAAAATVIGIAGTITTIAAGCLDLPGYDRDAIDQAVIAVADASTYITRLSRLPISARHELPYLHPGRVDVIIGGALIFERVLARTRVSSFVVSEFDILDGIAWSMA